MARYVTTRPVPRTSGGGASVAESDAWTDPIPAVFEYLTEQQYSDGTPRTTSTLLLFVEDGVWKAALNDRDASATLWVSGRTLGELLAALERALTAGTAEWRVKKQVGPEKGRKR